MVTTEEVSRFKKSLMEIRVSELQDAVLMERLEEVRRVLADLMGMLKPSMRPMVLKMPRGEGESTKLKKKVKAIRKSMQAQIALSELAEEDAVEEKPRSSESEQTEEVPAETEQATEQTQTDPLELDLGLDDLSKIEEN